MGSRAHQTKTIGLAAVALAALTVLVAACGGSGSSGTPATVEYTPPPDATTGTVEAQVGDTVIVRFAANATTGYSWTFTAGDTFTIESSEYVPDPNPGDLAGSGGTQVVTLKITAQGSSDLVGTYARPWETPSPDATPDFTLTVTGS